MFSGGTHRKGWQLLPQGGSEREAVKIEGPARQRVNNSFVVRDALLRGLGIGQLPRLVAAEALSAGQLAQVLPEWKPPSAPVHAVYPRNRYLSPKVRAFVDLAIARFPSEGDALLGAARVGARKRSRSDSIAEKGTATPLAAKRRQR